MDENGGLDPTESGKPSSEPKGHQQLDHGIYRCTTRATIPKAQRREGQPCPFCGLTLSATPTVTDDGTMKRASQWPLIVAVAFAAAFFALFTACVAALNSFSA